MLDKKAESWSSFNRYSLSPNRSSVLFVPVCFTGINVVWIFMITWSRAKGKIYINICSCFWSLPLWISFLASSFLTCLFLIIIDDLLIISMKQKKILTKWRRKNLTKEDKILTYGMLVHRMALSFEQVPGHCNFFHHWMAGGWYRFLCMSLLLLHTSHCIQKSSSYCSHHPRLKRQLKIDFYCFGYHTHYNISTFCM